MIGQMYVLSDSVPCFFSEATFGDLSSLLGSPTTVRSAVECRAVSPSVYNRTAHFIFFRCEDLKTHSPMLGFGNRWECTDT